MRADRAFGWLFTALAGLMIFPVVGEFFVEWAKEGGWYNQPSAKVRFVVDCIRAITDLPGFYLAFAFIAGIALAYWLFRWFLPLRAKTPGANAAETFLRLQFSADGSPSHAVELANVWRWYALGHVVVPVIAGQRSQEIKTWVLFVTFEKPVDVKQIIIEASGLLPRHEVKDRDARSIVIALMGDVMNCTVDIRVLSTPGHTRQPALQMAHQPKPTEYVSGQRIGANFSRNQGDEPAIMYKATGARAVDRLRIYLDLAQGTKLTGKVNFFRMKIADVFDVVRDKTFTMPIMNRRLNGSDYTFAWNTSDPLAPEFTIGECEGRISLIGDDEREQYLYFMTLRTDQHGDPYFKVIERPDFASKWEG